jgi:electron transport complex protein RnfD
MAPDTLPPRLGAVPLLRRPRRAGSLMWRVVLALAPVAVLGVAAYGWPALVLLLACLAGAVCAEAAGLAVRGARRSGRLGDGSAVLSGLLLALTLPPGLELGWGFLGGATAILLGKQVFGGLGRNPVNPALVGRLALSLLAPGPLERGWLQPFAWRELGWNAAASPQQDPLRLLWETRQVLDQALAGSMPVLPAGWPTGLDRLDLIQQAQDILSAAGPGHLLWAVQPGLLGEVSLLALLPGLAWLFTARLVDWRVPAAGVFFLPLGFLLASGGADGSWLPLALDFRGSTLLLLLCVFAADPVTSPLGQSAKFLFGLLVAAGSLAVLSLGPQAAGLLLVLPVANLLTPWLDRVLLPRGPQ